MKATRLIEVIGGEDEGTEAIKVNESQEETVKQQKAVTSQSNKSLLRLEKDYFEDVYHENKDKKYTDVLVKKLLREDTNSLNSKKKP